LDRRRFVAGLSCLLASPLAGEAQQKQSHRVAVLTLNPRSGTAATMLDGLRQRFKELGYHDGENLVLEYRFADGNRDLLPALALELLKLQPAVIVTFGTPATVVAKTISIQAAVERLIDARSSRRLLTPFSESHGNFTLGHAYAIQDALRFELERRGERPIGC